MNDFISMVNDIRASDDVELIASGGLNERELSAQEMAHSLAIVDMRPISTDVTWEAWLYRISSWGKVRIQYYDPMLKRKSDVSQKQMIALIMDDNLMKSFGKWSIEWPDFNRVDVFRTYIGANGKQETEKFIVKIDLRPEIKKSTPWWKFW